MNGDHVDTKKQVLPELFAGDHLGQVFVGGGDDPHIDPHRTVIADPVELPGFQNPQQFDLHGQRHVADFVQKDVPAGEFTTAFLAHIVGRHYYEPVVRPALLTAVLGYTFVVIGLLVDIVRSWAIWKPMVFWNFNSVLFEVAMCVMFYLNVLYRWDWSKAGDKTRKPRKDKYGMGDYDPKKGEFAWRESAKPVYRWHGGFYKRVLLGDRIDLEAAVTNIAEPVGSIRDPNSKIAPFKIMKGVQPADAKHAHLLVPHLFPRDKEDKTAFWKHFDWQKAITEGMRVAGLPYSGNFKWVETWMYWGVDHEVMPADMALSCVQCHDSLKGERTCDRCHQDSRLIDFKKVAHKGTDFSWMAEKGRDVSHLVGTTDYIDFKALGYKGDPIVHGGRFKQLPMGYRPAGQ